MDEHWRQADRIISQIEIIGTEGNELVDINGHPQGAVCIGIGTDAAVFLLKELPGYAFKIYSELSQDKIEAEVAVYERLRGCPYFPVYYGRGAHYIVISHEEGPTLLDCLIQGIPVPEQVIQDVEDARTYVRSQGLNPRDIHLKNVLLQGERAKVLDVSEYIKDGNDNRWEHLVWAYRTIYPRISGKPIPARILDTIKKWYNRLDKANMNLEEFANRANGFFKRWKL